jgi:hypothetical protein
MVAWCAGDRAGDYLPARQLMALWAAAAAPCIPGRHSTGPIHTFYIFS